MLDQPSIVPAFLDLTQVGDGLSLTRTPEDPWQLPAADATWVAEHEATVLYTDGSHLPDSGFAAWAWWVDAERYASGTLAGATSTHAERLAVLQALRAYRRRPVLVVTDQTGLVPKRLGSARTPAHTHVTARLRELLRQDTVRVLTVRGHQSCTGNNAADALAGRTLRAEWEQICADPHRHAEVMAQRETAAAQLARRRQVLREQYHRDRADRQTAQLATC